jgi:hypothetical protein
LLEKFAIQKTASAIHKLSSLNTKLARLVGAYRSTTIAYNNDNNNNDNNTIEINNNNNNNNNDEKDIIFYEEEKQIDSALIHIHDIIRIVTGFILFYFYLSSCFFNFFF